MPIAAYEKQYGRGPHVAVDALVEWRKTLLLIRRGDGSWALPGGFVNPGEALLDAAIRELGEETSINLSADVLRSAFKEPARVFSDPGRDPRSHIITHVHCFLLSDSPEITVCAADDAKALQWIGASQITGLNFYADHLSIIRSLWSP